MTDFSQEQLNVTGASAAGWRHVATWENFRLTSRCVKEGRSETTLGRVGLEVVWEEMNEGRLSHTTTNNNNNYDNDNNGRDHYENTQVNSSLQVCFCW